MFTNAIKTSHLRPEKPQAVAATAHRIGDHKIANVTMPRGGVSPFSRREAPPFHSRSDPRGTGTVGFILLH